MNRTEFFVERKSRTCAYCHQPYLEFRESDTHLGGGVWCRYCGRFQFWLSKDRADAHRPKLKQGTIPEVWEAWGGHCAHCGLSKSHLSVLGIGFTVQHCPPFKEVEEDRYLIPLCAWCQQDSASRMKRLETLVKRLSSKMSMPVPDGDYDDQ